LRQKALNSSQKGAQGKGEKVGKGKDKKSGEQGLETPGRPLAGQTIRLCLHFTSARNLL